jgi:hypothetical protein
MDWADEKIVRELFEEDQAQLMQWRRRRPFPLRNWAHLILANHPTMAFWDHILYLGWEICNLRMDPIFSPLRTYLSICS